MRIIIIERDKLTQVKLCMGHRKSQSLEIYQYHHILAGEETSFKNKKKLPRLDSEESIKRKAEAASKKEKNKNRMRQQAAGMLLQKHRKRCSRPGMPWAEMCSVVVSTTTAQSTTISTTTWAEMCSVVVRFRQPECFTCFIYVMYSYILYIL